MGTNVAAPTIRLVLVDDHPLILDALESLFDAEPDLVVLARCTDGEEALLAVQEHEPDVLIIDLRMPGLDGLGVVRALATSGAATRAVLLTGGLSDDELVESIRLEVAGVILKERAPKAIVDCVRTVHRGKSWIEPAAFVRAAKLMVEPDPGDSRLTDRELDVVRLVARGLRSKDIAGRLRITEGTVKTHLHNIYAKLGVDGRYQLFRRAQEWGLVDGG